MRIFKALCVGGATMAVIFILCFTLSIIMMSCEKEAYAGIDFKMGMTPDQIPTFLNQKQADHFALKYWEHNSAREAISKRYKEYQRQKDNYMDRELVGEELSELVTIDEQLAYLKTIMDMFKLFDDASVGSVAVISSRPLTEQEIKEWIK